MSGRETGMEPASLTDSAGRSLVAVEIRAQRYAGKRVQRTPYHFEANRTTAKKSLENMSSAVET